jgi:hypothetical protein
MAELLQLPEVPHKLLLPTLDVVYHRKANPCIIYLLQADYHPEEV